MFDLDNVNKRLEQQDEQIKKFNKAQELVKNGDVEEGIQILENIMYKEGLVVRGVNWPFILAKIYYSHKMFNECWVYLNFIQSQRLGEESKILEYQSKIRNAEKKYKDTLFLKILALYKKYSCYIDIPSEEMIQKELIAILNKMGKPSDNKYTHFILDSLQNKTIDIEKLKKEITKEEI